jgi:hypothetical protein
MAENKDEEHLDNPTNNQSENPSDNITPTKNIETITQNQETENMEVHHHAHNPAEPHHKKNWKSYLWEFFMLFLAVFCGSLAELQVEHYIEHQREKKYAQTLLDDLVNDTADLKYDIDGWIKVNQSVDTIILEMEKEVNLRNHQLLYKNVASLNTNNTFLYHDRTIQQLKSAGNFRLIRDKAIADSIVEYDSYIVTAVKNIEDVYAKVINPETANLQSQLFNSKYFNIVRDKQKLDSIFIQFPEKIIMQKNKEDIVFQFYNKVHNYKDLTNARIYFLSTTLRRATNLISLLKSHYHID